MNEVHEPTQGFAWECPRCLENYCENCVEKHKVDFDIIDKPFGRTPCIRAIQWRHLLVCPWCYNGLLKRYKP